MNNYPKWWNTTITLYNKYVDSTKRVKWFPHIIEGCFYDHVKDQITVNNTVITSDSTICRIRASEAFINPKDWDALPDEAEAIIGTSIIGTTIGTTIGTSIIGTSVIDTKENRFTIRPGDIIIAGEVDFEIDEYTKGKRSSDLIAEYQPWPGCFVIETVSINVGGGRGNEHYSVKGK